MYDTDSKKVRQKRRQGIKQGIVDNHKKAPKEARLAARLAVKQAKTDYRLAKKDYRLLKEDKPTARAMFFKRERDRAKLKHQIQKKVYQRAKKEDSTYLPNRIKRRSLQSTKTTAKRKIEDAVGEDSGLSDIVRARRQARQLRYQKATSKQALKASKQLGKYTIKGAYGLSNRTYNKIRGRGFTRTPKALSWEGKLQRNRRQLQARLGKTKLGRFTKGSGRVLNTLSSPLKTILKNPLSVKSYALLVFLIFCASLVMAVFSGSGPVQQDEFDLNRSWLYLSKRDREQSNDEVDYWTPIDDILFYMNVRYGGEWTPDTTWDEGTGGKWGSLLGFNHYSDALDDLWNGLNSDPNNLKTMMEVATGSGKKWMTLDADTLADYKEFLELSKEVGRFPSYQELENPFYSDDDEEHNKLPLTILKRFGYSSKDEIYDKTQLKASRGQTLKAVMSGKVSLDKDTVTIKTAQARFSYEAVGSIRIKSGDRVTAGDDIGVVTTNGYQTIHYQKWRVDDKDNQKGKWVSVNPGFYFTAVTYNQTTSVMSRLDGNLAEKVRQIRDYLKPKVPNLSMTGLAAMLGNFATESNITSKRAESDYLNPPIGASSSSWDDDAWLNMGYGEGASIGALVLHRGLGLGMWTDTSDGANRSTLLRQYANSQGKKWYDLELQLDFILSGDNPYYTTIAKTILTSKDDVSTLTKRFLNQWEGNAGDKVLERQNNAKQIYTLLTQTVAGGGTLASSWNFPESYRDKVPNPPTSASMTTQAGNHYPVGQCTWYAYNRLVELGIFTDLSGAYGFLGNGQDWVRSLARKGWKTSSMPSQWAVCSTAGGFDHTYPQYGHVMIVEAVNPDGSFLVSECNYAGNQQQIHFRVCQPAPYYSFASP